MLLALLCLAQFVAVLDGTLVLVALPLIGRDLSIAGGDLQWVVTAYALVFAGCLLIAGRLADAFGRRRLFATGVALFTAASLCCGAAPGGGVLVIARAAQGLGAALATPAALAMIVEAFPRGRARERAIGVWTGVAAVGGAVGLALGGVVAGSLGWRAIFFVNVPVGLVALALTPRVLRESRGDAPSQGVDLLGAGLATTGLGSLVLAFTEAEQSGPAEPLTLASLGGAAFLLTALVFRERAAPHPVVPPALIAARPIAAALLAGCLLTATTSGGAVLATLQLQGAVGLGPVDAGLSLLPFSLAAAAGSIASPRLAGRPRSAVVGGLSLVCAGSAVAAAGVTATSGSVAIVSWGVLCGCGIGIASVAATAVGVSATAPGERGTAAALLNTAAQIGTALGVAGLVLLAGLSTPTAGHRLGFAVASCVAGLGSVVLAVLLQAEGVDRGQDAENERGDRVA